MVLSRLNSTGKTENYQYVRHLESKRYKRNSITSDLNRIFRISSCLNDEISKIRQKVLNAGYLLWFINSVIKQFNDRLSVKSNQQDDEILPPDFFEIKKQVILIEVPCYGKKTKQLVYVFLRYFSNSIIIYMKSK